MSLVYQTVLVFMLTESKDRSYVTKTCLCVCILNRNWCAYVVTKTISCVVEDGVETYVKPDYHPCSWGSGQCSRAVV